MNNALAQYMQMFQQNRPMTQGNVQGAYFNDPYNQFIAQMQFARGQQNADLENEDRRSQIDFRNRMGQSFGQMPNFYGDGPKMPEYQQQPMYQFGGQFPQRQPMSDNNAGSFNALAALARRGS